MLRDRSAKVQNGAVFDWDDLRAFLAVAETGSTLAAGKRLRVSQTTAARRVAALEQALGLTLFERRPAGYALTPAGEALVEPARAVAAAAGTVAETAASLSRELTGTVRLTTLEIYAATILPPSCATSTKRIPESSSTSTPPRSSATSPPARRTSP